MCIMHMHIHMYVYICICVDIRFADWKHFTRCNQCVRSLSLEYLESITYYQEEKSNDKRNKIISKTHTHTQEPSWSYKKARAVSHTQSSETSKLDDGPMRFEAKKSVNGFLMIQASSCTDDDGNVRKRGTVIFYKLTTRPRNCLSSCSKKLL